MLTFIELVVFTPIFMTDWTFLRVTGESKVVFYILNASHVSFFLLFSFFLPFPSLPHFDFSRDEILAQMILCVCLVMV